MYWISEYFYRYFHRTINKVVCVYYCFRWKSFKGNIHDFNENIDLCWISTNLFVQTKNCNEQNKIDGKENSYLQCNACVIGHSVLNWGVHVDYMHRDLLSLTSIRLRQNMAISYFRYEKMNLDFVISVWSVLIFI